MKDKITRPIIDVNVRIGTSVYGFEQSPKHLLKLMNQFGIETSIVSCFTPPDLSFVRGNRTIETAVRENPSRLKGLARVDPRSPDSVRTLQKFLSKKSFVGIFLHPFEQAFKVNDSLVKPLYEVAEKMDVPVMLESGYPIVSLPLQMAEAASEFRRVNFIMTHAGQMLASGQSEGDSLHVMLENRNVFCDTSQIILSGIGGFIEQVLHARKKGSQGRVLFGSGSPQGSLSVESLRVSEAKISEEEKRQVFFHNAEKLFHL